MKWIHHNNLFQWTWRGKAYGLTALAGLSLLILLMVVA